ncbi:MAG: hypothetical protein ACPLGZ_03015, partial [Candidatus Pelagibacter ubique]
MSKKIFEIIIIIVSIALASSLIFISQSITTEMRNKCVEQLKKESAYSDLNITPKEDSQNNYIDIEKINLISGVKDTNGYLEVVSVCKPDEATTNIQTIYGLDSSYIEKYKITNINNKPINNIADNSIIIGQSFAKKYDINKGDTVSYIISGQLY